MDDDSPAPETTLGAEIEALRRQLDDKQDRLLRALAETDNVRRRAQRDREDYTRFATESLLRDLVPVLDNFDRALTAAGAAQEASGVVAGVELIQREILKVLERHGLASVKGAPHTFDADGYVALLQRLKTTERIIYAPEFRREIEERGLA